MIYVSDIARYLRRSKGEVVDLCHKAGVVRRRKSARRYEPFTVDEVRAIFTVYYRLHSGGRPALLQKRSERRASLPSRTSGSTALGGSGGSGGTARTGEPEPRSR